jgi:hypothetical protein
MPRYVIERQFLVPVFEHIFVEAPDLETACREAMDDGVQPWGDHSKMDFDNSRAVTVTQAVAIPEGSFPELRSRDNEDPYMLSEILYDSGLEFLPIPEEIDEDGGNGEEPIGFA